MDWRPRPARVPEGHCPLSRAGGRSVAAPLGSRGSIFIFDLPLTVVVTTGSGGASWTDPSGFQKLLGYSPTVTINPGPGTSANFLRLVLVPVIAASIFGALVWCAATIDHEYEKYNGPPEEGVGDLVVVIAQRQRPSQLGRLERIKFLRLCDPPQGVAPHRNEPMSVCWTSCGYKGRRE
jgi:hypothetical protein